MKVEFIPEGAQDCPLVLIYGSDRREIQQLGESFEQLAEGKIDHFDILAIPGFSSVDLYNLVASVSRRDIGVQKEGSGIFKWQLTPISWSNVTGLVEPFWKENLGGHAHQFLQQEGDISVLISTDRSW